MKNQRMKRLLGIAFAVLLSVSVAACGKADTSKQPQGDGDQEKNQSTSAVKADVPLQKLDAAEGDADYYKKLYENQLYNRRLVDTLGATYEENSRNAYMQSTSKLPEYDPDNLTDEQKEELQAAYETQQKLVQIASYEDSAWHIWGEDIPQTEETLTFSRTDQDNEDFEPILNPFLLEDQENVKGNFIVIAGGGYTERQNESEGYVIAKKYNTLGYNAFVLQRRVAPYGEYDIWMDMQRAVRYLRHNAEALGLGGMDMLGATGFSGGGMTILGQVQHCYGNILPSAFDSDYVPDEVDQVNSDLDVACIIYGPGEYKTENPNPPAFFIAAGANDKLGTGPASIQLAQKLIDTGAKVELHYINGAEHGFGVGNETNSSLYWMECADAFVQSVKKGDGPMSAETVDWPDFVEKYAQIDVMGMPVFIGANEEETKVYALLSVSGLEVSGEGVVEDGVPVLGGDLKGYPQEPFQEAWGTIEEWEQLKK